MKALKTLVCHLSREPIKGMSPLEKNKQTVIHVQSNLYTSKFGGHS